MAENGITLASEDGLLADKMESKEHTPENLENHQKLLDYGINAKIADEVLNIYESGKLKHCDLDERALDALKEFNPDDGVSVLKQFSDVCLKHVANKSAFLCGMMKTYRQNKKQGSSAATAKGPDEQKLKDILARTGYSLDVTTGQRKYGGPPPGSEESSTPPGSGHEIFVGKIPKDVFEDELIPLFEECGKIWDLRLMMDPMTGFNRGYCFVTYCEKAGAQEAVNKLDNHAIKEGKNIKVNISVANQRLFVGSIPKNKSREEILEEFTGKTEGLTDVIIYRSADKESQKNRGFAFLEFDSHKSASIARRRLASGRVKVWGAPVVVDWADPIEEPDDETMAKVKVLYVRNISRDVTEELLKEKFGDFGKVERVKKIKDYGFIHYEEREDAVKAQQEMDGMELGNLKIEVSMAKPPTENRKKEHRKRDQERRHMFMAMGRGGYYGYDDYWGPPMRPPMHPRGGMRRPAGPPMPPRGYEYYDDFYNYDDFYDYGYQQGPRGGRGGRGGQPPMRGRGGGPPRGGGPRGGMIPRGARGAMRGSRGMIRGRGGAGGPSSPPPNRGGKRKAGNEIGQSQTKRRNTQENWGAQPIAQQPLDQSGSYGGDYNDTEWYQDSYGQNWG
ncbi:heterogeneous nuclear ribonucleoprotein Q-like isoform X1 [Argopecten irradians]|uniref:heterogeneous nuclear ribonucleoprotein Q-like isoform X1 n=1 Tax=Argopecten irradians TaxID=31199 RepID=UPI00372214A0